METYPLSVRTRTPSPVRTPTLLPPKPGPDFLTPDLKTALPKKLTRSTSVYNGKTGLNLFGRTRTTSSASSTSATSTPGHSRHLSYSPLAPKHRAQQPGSNLDAITCTPVASPTKANEQPPDDLLSLPINPATIEGLDMNDQLRLLAMKEMSIVEMRDNIKALTETLQRLETELHDLKQLVQRSLYKEMVPVGRKNLQQKLQTDSEEELDPRAAAIRLTRNRRSSSLTSPQKPKPVKTRDPESKRFSFLAKPLDLLNQFDTMLQNEFEKSLSVRDENFTEASAASDDLAELSFTTPPDQPDVMNTVSNSIWSFVSEVKTNLMQYQEEIPRKPKEVELGVMHAHEASLNTLAELTELPSRSATPQDVSRFPSTSITPKVGESERFERPFESFSDRSERVPEKRFVEGSTEKAGERSFSDRSLRVSSLKSDPRAEKAGKIVNSEDELDFFELQLGSGSNAALPQIFVPRSRTKASEG
ncbi:hypothetical protein BABINDRAFT_10115 [Babjeviella inositovora NRRL Y-12698]|uniref:Topoisomerase I damage affected protein 11 n=1 Tax=Babjeviella inositovora NRRL Y-12698 TaxID=984486 RepID=A0A1E3QIF0_9ASCO|nr:uncharacterized protein BABINDRAFT_10115 [Babjeviella inositovora NRRL Y-12698]ODQ77475.1 hypothetical protein BABINDRAFT_10115 [Babjeviella inositovora NRRL Y-12698]